MLDPHPFILVGTFFCVVVAVMGLVDWREPGILHETCRLILIVVLSLLLAYFAVSLMQGRY